MKLNSLILWLVLGCFIIVTPAFAQAPMKLNFSLQNMGEVKIGNRIITTHSLAGMATIKSELETRMGGTVEMVIHPGSSLGNITECMEQTKLGVITGVLIESSYLAKFAAEIQVFGIPYLFPSQLVAYDVLSGPFGHELYELIAKKSGFRVLCIWPSGFRHFGNNVRPIKTAADMKGLKMRTMPNPVHMEMMKALGARPTPVDWSEVYTSLQTGVVDGMENNPGNTVSQRWHEVTKYYTLDGHFMSIVMILIGDSWFKKQSKEMRDALIESGIIGAIAGTGTYAVNEQIELSEIKRVGVKVYAPTIEEKETFRKAALTPVVNYLKKEVGAEWVDKMLKAVEESKKKYGY